MEPIILASSSPRRQEILHTLNIPFVVNPADIDETVHDMKPEEIPEFLAAKKVETVVKRISQTTEPGWVLAADTVILFKNKIFGKPKDIDEARDFIKKLQGTSHKVITGLALYNGKIHYMSTRTSVNKVTFKEMTDKEIDFYLNTSEWHGVAGAYRIQGMGSCFIKKN